MHSNPTTSACPATALRVATIDVNLAMSSHIGCLYEYTTPATSPTGTTSAVSFRCNEPVQVKMFTDLPPQRSATLKDSKRTPVKWHIIFQEGQETLWKGQGRFTW